MTLIFTYMAGFSIKTCVDVSVLRKVNMVRKIIFSAPSNMESSREISSRKIGGGETTKCFNKVRWKLTFGCASLPREGTNYSGYWARSCLSSDFHLGINL
jgi:hypothetical protein